jgi:hypothetical protein
MDDFVNVLFGSNNEWIKSTVAADHKTGGGMFLDLFVRLQYVKVTVRNALRFNYICSCLDKCSGGLVHHEMKAMLQCPQRILFVRERLCSDDGSVDSDLCYQRIKVFPDIAGYIGRLKKQTTEL